MSSEVNEFKWSDSQEESVDPRVQVELERLNTATDLINRLEIELDEARSNFRLLLSDSSQKINQLTSKLGSCIEKARPYYDSRIRAKELQAESQRAALRYERASSAHTVAKEMVHLAEEGLQKEGRTFDPAWQEMLNHATKRVNEAEIERVRSEHEHQETSLAYNDAEQRVLHLHQDLKRAIVKSSLSTRRSLLQLNNLANQHQLQLLPYFEMKAQFNQMLEEQKKKVNQLEENVAKVKMSYADALHNLEEISDEIHHRRKTKDPQPVRGEGVGAESPVLSRHPIPCMNSEGSASDRKLEQKLAPERTADPDDVYLRLPDSLSTKTALFLSTSSSPSAVSDSEKMVNSCDNCTDNSTDKSYDKQIIISASALHSKEITSKHKYSNNLDSGIHNNSSTPSVNGQLPVMVSCCNDLSSGSTVLEYNQSLSNESLSDEMNQDAQSACLPPFHEDRYRNLDYLFDKYDSRVQECLSTSPENQLRKLSGTDSNMLRIHKEDMSDTDSLASGGTGDTLDDHQIECLLLDKFFEQEFQSLSNQCEDLTVDSEL